MRFLIPILFGLVLCLHISAQATLFVPSTPYPTIQSAVNAATTGDTVWVAAGTYYENLVFPAMDFYLLGAGPGLSIVDGMQTGSCMSFQQGPVTHAMVIEGFTLTNGSGEYVFQGGWTTVGGGVFLSNALFSAGPPISPRFKNCEITKNTSAEAAAIFARYGGNVEFLDCNIHNNTATRWTSYAGAIFGQYAPTNLLLRGCRIADHAPYDVRATVYLENASASLEQCEFVDNTAKFHSGVFFSGSSGVAPTPTTLNVKNCSFVGGIGQSVSASTLWVGGSFPTVVENCLFANNMGGLSVLGMSASASRSIRNCTFVANQLGALSPGVVTFSGLTAQPSVLRLENSIVVDNVDAVGSVIESVALFAGTTATLVLTNSIVETIANSSTLVKPEFVDPVNGNYRLKPGSVGVDGGTSVNLNPPSPTIATTMDLDGAQRVKFGGIDMGPYEGQHISYHPSAWGKVGISNNGPFDVLQVNGSFGDVFRTVSVPLGTSTTVSMLQPPNLASPAGFAIFGMVGEATEQSIITVPLGIGEMTFAPCPVFPWFPVLFTLTNNLGSFCPQFVPSTPTPWVSFPFPVISFPLTLTFQGVVEESPGVYVPTNMVVYKAE